MIYFVTGGERSGKSSYAQNLALELSSEPVYLATSRILDDDFRKRVDHHKESRGACWTNIEEEKFLSRENIEGRVVVIDCVTLWALNFFHDNGEDVEKSLDEMKAEFDLLTQLEGTFIIVSNELGMGIHAETRTGRKFAELQGWINQHIAARADKAVLMVSGIPMTLK